MVNRGGIDIVRGLQDGGWYRPLKRGSNFDRDSVHYVA